LIKTLYTTLRGLIIFVLILGFIFVLLMSHKSVLPYLANKYLHDYEVNYSSISGSLVSGFIIKDVQYKNAIEIKSLSVKYNPLLLIRLTPKISFIATKDLKVDASYFNTDKEDEQALDLMNFQVSKITLLHSEVSYEDKIIKFDAFSKGLFFDNSLHVDELILKNTSIKDTHQEINLSLTSENISYEKSLKLSKIALKIDLKDDTYGNFQTNFNGSKITYANNLANIEDFTMFLQSPYGKLYTNAKLKDNIIIAKAKVTPKESFIEEHLNFITKLPKTFNIDLNVSTQKVSIYTKLKELSPKYEQNLTAKNALLHVDYLIEKNRVDFKADYDLSYQNYALHVKQIGTVDQNLSYQTSLKTEILKTPMKLPIDSFDVTLDGNTSFMNADINSTFVNINTKTKDFNELAIETYIKALPLDFIAKDFKEDVLFSKSSSLLQISPFNLKSQIKAQDQHIKYSGIIETDLNSLLVKGDIEPKLKSKIFDNINPSIISDLNFVYFNDANNNMLNIDANRTNITIFEKNGLLNGWGNLDKNSFNVSGNKEKNGQSDIKLSASFPSIKKLLEDIKIENNNIQYDAEVNLEAQIIYDNQIELKSLITVPWYYVLLDDDTSYSGVDLSFEVEKKQDNLVITNYNIDFLDHRIHSKKPSIISLDNNQTIQIKELWVYDNLLLKGDIATKEKSINLKINSDRFTYNGQEGNVTAKTDISLQINEKEQNIEGYITLFDGIIKYIPKKSYSITDDDIIIIQDINNEVINNRFINIHIDSTKNIKYKIKNINLDIRPDFSIFKDKGENVKILGLATIDKGEVTALDKLFTIDKSEVYFYGDNTNPMLNLNIKHQTLDYKDIDIFVTGKLESPVVIFSSKQSLSQNDIMSYILFGEPASNISSNSSQNGNTKVYLGSLLLGTQLKQILNQSKSFKIDTLNILTTEEGSLGYEIGSRINKDLRVIYKNNVVSSVIVQYSVNKSVRVDVDVNQESQGVSFIYTKDF